MERQQSEEGREKALEDICGENKPKLWPELVYSAAATTMKASIFVMGLIKGLQWAEGDLEDSKALLYLGGLAAAYVGVEVWRRYNALAYLRYEFSCLDGKIEELKQLYATSNQREGKE